MSIPNPEQPIQYLRDLIEEGHTAGDPDAHAAALATADTVNARPSVRTVFVHVTEDGVAFFVNAKSGKGRQLEWNPQAALCFFWRDRQVQVTLEGSVELLSDDSADKLWKTRPHESSLAAHASRQHAHAGDKAALKSRVHEEKQRFGFVKVTRPSHWIGYRLLPERLEFWDSGWHRMRMRQLFELTPDGKWREVDQEP